jgi:dTDP-4-dehydrorhamnose 3,5-epimerase
MIEGVKIIQLKQIIDERGKVMHMLKQSDDYFQEFGEIYFSIVNPGAIKGWHIHKKMILNYAVPYGNIKFVLYDDREKSSTFGEIQEIFIGPDNYCLVVVPPLVWNGFKGIGVQPAIVANCSSIVHDSNEIDRLDPFDKKIPYNWEIKHR